MIFPAEVIPFPLVLSTFKLPARPVVTERVPIFPVVIVALVIVAVPIVALAFI